MNTQDIYHISMGENGIEDMTIKKIYFLRTHILTEYLISNEYEKSNYHRGNEKK